MMSKHTPGPWDIVPLANCQAIQTGSHSRICTLWDHRDLGGIPCGSVESRDKTQAEIEANARLIAAAPDLLKAIRRAIRLERDEDGCTCEMYEGEQCPLCEYKAAIAKAEPKAEGE